MNTENWRNSYGNNQITLLRTLEFSELYEKTNVQRPLTIFEWTIAKEMYMDFNRLFAQLGQQI